jgi:uncharacterized protein DUF4124
MRIPTSILCLLAVSAPLAAATTYKWVDKDGTLHYSDQPQPGAEVIHVDTTPPGSVAPQAASARPVLTTPRPFAYTSCTVSSPSPDQVFFNTRSVNVSLNLQPALQPDHTVVVTVNGGKVAWPPGSTSYQLQDLSRGSFSVSAQVLNEKGVALCKSPPLTFHIRQPSMLTPGARAAPRS